MTADDKTIYVASVKSKDKSHTSQWIANDTARVIDLLESTHSGCIIGGLVTDNAAANKAAWKILKEKYPYKFYYCCASHALQLIVKTLVGEDNDPMNPFSSLKSAADHALEIVNFSRNHHVEKAKFESRLAACNLPKLFRPAKTRWGSVKGCALSIDRSYEVLASLVVNEVDFITRGGSQQVSKRTLLRETIADR
ncbi:hypothetical protein AeMF1_000559 [Aphanomyces euteiches]|nr:hypothetical protein AeMF1_000559 [Aphanomyces euteiches]KAH9185675.1 hypothetical protein AeNC1_012349 [Aphanomyces euteiches]